MADKKWIQKAIKRPGRMREYAKREGLNMDEAIRKAKKSKNKSLKKAAILAITLRSMKK